MKKMEEGQKNLRMFEENDMKVNLKEQNYKNVRKWGYWWFYLTIGPIHLCGWVKISSVLNI